ncbi:lipopolysaccharide assembly protein LapB [Malonomonas rubra]|uniref:tetratricopeptide repeat protein n=1 Tax=Malonomonas rubra TaxID=57040 RepID=UPI0026EB2DBE|nr:tetratricopeptide repeat protein [Malonomonas rubra]
MGFLSKLFGGGPTIDGLRKAMEQKRFADARVMVEELLEKPLADEELEEVKQLKAAAGDGLARLNLDEALGYQRAGEEKRAVEHLELALAQVCSVELRKEIEAAALLAPTVEPPEQAAIGHKHSGSCSSCGPQVMEPLSSDDIEFPDHESQLELILTSYPPQIAERYQQKGEQFLQAFLLSHSGQDDVALAHWQQVPPIEQDELYWFELGAAQARVGQVKQACKNLEKALQLAPGLLPASEMLIQVLVSLGDAEAAMNRLEQMLEQGQDPAFCHVQLVLVRLQQQQQGQALTHARQALALGVIDPNFLQLAASLLEQAGEMEEAETVLRRIPSGGGCGGGGGMSLPLAEFLLRQKRDLGKLLDTFNAACRQDPQNPRWQLRAAQTYMARNWTKEGLELLNKVVHDPQLDPELKQEAEQLLASQKA